MEAAKDARRKAGVRPDAELRRVDLDRDDLVGEPAGPMAGAILGFQREWNGTGSPTIVDEAE